MGQKQDRKYQNQEVSTFSKNLILILTEEKHILLHQKRAQNSEQDRIKTELRISELRDEHIFFALDYAMESLQRIQR